MSSKVTGEGDFDSYTIVYLIFKIPTKNNYDNTSYLNDFIKL